MFKMCNKPLPVKLSEVCCCLYVSGNHWNRFSVKDNVFGRSNGNTAVCQSNFLPSYVMKCIHAFSWIIVILSKFWAICITACHLELKCKITCNDFKLRNSYDLHCLMVWRWLVVCGVSSKPSVMFMKAAMGYDLEYLYDSRFDSSCGTLLARNDSVVLFRRISATPPWL